MGIYAVAIVVAIVGAEEPPGIARGILYGLAGISCIIGMFVENSRR